MTNRSNPFNEVSRYGSFTGCRVEKCLDKSLHTAQVHFFESCFFLACGCGFVWNQNFTTLPMILSFHIYQVLNPTHYHVQAMNPHHNRAQMAESKQLWRGGGQNKFNNILNSKKVKQLPYRSWSTYFKLQQPSTHLICQDAICTGTCTKQIKFGDLAGSLAAISILLAL